MEDELVLLGGDLRMHWAARELRRQGRAVITCCVPHEPEQPLPHRISTLVLPFPAFQGERIRGASTPGVKEILPALQPGSRVFGGLLEPWAAAFGERGAQCCELYGSEPLTTANAALTAEGAMALAMQHLPIALEGMHCLVIGFGRIGKLLARKLSALGAEVRVSARSASDRAMAEALGYGSEETGHYHHGLSAYELILNTVPHRILTASQLAGVREDCLLVELASQPGGIPRDSCEALGLSYLAAPGLPGSYAPKTAGILYARSILAGSEGKDGH